MVHIEAKAVIPMPADLYWAVRNTQEFHAIECRVLKSGSKITSKERINDAGAMEYVQLKSKPDLSGVPSFLKSMLPPEGIVYTDDVEFVFNDPITPYAFKARTWPNIARDNCSITSYVRLIPSADGKSCVQSITMDIKVDLWMGIGSAVESLVKKGVLDGYKHLPAMATQYIELYLENSDSGISDASEEQLPRVAVVNSVLVPVREKRASHGGTSDNLSFYRNSSSTLAVSVA